MGSRRVGHDWATSVCVCVSVRGLRESKTYSLSYLKCRLTCFPCRQAQNLCSIQGDQRPTLLLLMSAQDFPHFNFPKISLWIQYTSYQITSELFHKIRTKNFLQFLWIHTRPQDTKSNLEKDTKAILRKKKQNWSIQAPWLQTVLQNYSHQDSMVLAQKQKYRSMGQDWKPKDKPTYLWSPNLWQRRQEYSVEKRQSFQQVVLGKLDSYM